MTAPRAALKDRVGHLKQAATLADGRSDPAAVAEARRVSEQADRRLAFSGNHTVLAIAGATGSGKSSLFNAIAGAQLARTGVTRPVTDKPMSAVWGPDGASELLTWLEIPHRHLISDGDARFDGLVLLDLPDHDSIDTSHRLEVDRLVQQVDGMIWVVDPQKYADNVLHERYLRPYAKYSDVIWVVLNHIDLLSEAEREVALRDLRSLLNAEGLSKVKVLATSALTGEGLVNLRNHIAATVKAKRLAANRLSADISRAAEGFASDLSRNRNRQVTAAQSDRLVQTLLQAAGVPEVCDAVGAATKRRGSLATGWPLTSWINKLKPDPLQVLHLDRVVGTATAAAIEPVRLQRTSLRLSNLGQSRIDTALRDLSDDLSGGMSSGWAGAVRQASIARRPILPDELDTAVAETDLGMAPPRWWGFVRVVQWVLIAVIVIGLGWLALRGIFSYFQLPEIPVFRWHGIPLPTLLVFGGILAGILVGLLARAGVWTTARHRSARARVELTASVAAVAEVCVIQPVNAELGRYADFVAALAKAL